MKRRFPAAMAAAALALSCLTGCAPQPAAQEAPPAQTEAAAEAVEARTERVSDVGFYFDTVLTFTLYDAPDGLMDELWADCAYYEGLLSKTVPDSDVSRINASGGQPVKVSHETWEILREAKRISGASGHAFSVTLGPAVSLWDFSGGMTALPDARALEDAVALVDDDALVLGEDDTVILPAGMAIDLGGIAKGYIADRVADRCRERGVRAVLNLGGNVYVVGEKPDGSAWRVGIRDPQGSASDVCAVLTVRDISVVTSGIYERQVVLDGTVYHHILDPKTGVSASSDLASATVVCTSSMEADAVATACIVLGSKDALELLRRLGLPGMLITRDGETLTTEGFAGQYQAS